MGNLLLPYEIEAKKHLNDREFESVCKKTQEYMDKFNKDLAACTELSEAEKIEYRTVTREIEFKYQVAKALEGKFNALVKEKSDPKITDQRKVNINKQLTRIAHAHSYYNSECERFRETAEKIGRKVPTLQERRKTKGNENGRSNGGPEVPKGPRKK